MDAAGWLGAEDPHPMFAFLKRSVTPRKLRLFGVACCRRIENLMTDDECRRAVVLAEWFADGGASEEELASLRERLTIRYQTTCKKSRVDDKQSMVSLWCLGAAAGLLQAGDAYLGRVPIGQGDAELLNVCNNVQSAIGFDSADSIEDQPTEESFAESRAHADLLREVVGNPFSPITFSRQWRTPEAADLAERIYDKRAFDQMPNLGDMLEKAGCREVSVISHCHDQSEHVRGCWVLDSMLGRV